jgi:SAM-dependent methyltransferase
MSDFWAQFDKSYRLFSQFCDSDDWHLILKVVAGAVIKYAGNPSCQISILDVGCGSGAATQTVCEQIYAKTGCFPSLSVVEPSSVALARLASNTLPNSDCGPLHHAVTEVDKLPSELRVDAILFLHSTYYIDDLESKLKKLVDFHLRPGGAICALVLPEQSPFFLSLPCLANCSDAVESIFRSLNLVSRSVTLKSRFLLPKGGEFAEAEWEALQKFVMPSANSLAAFKERLNQHKDQDGQIDFQDHLLIGKKPAK